MNVPIPFEGDPELVRDHQRKAAMDHTQAARLRAFVDEASDALEVSAQAARAAADSFGRLLTLVRETTDVAAVDYPIHLYVGSNTCGRCGVTLVDSDRAVLAPDAATCKAEA